MSRAARRRRRGSGAAEPRTGAAVSASGAAPSVPGLLDWAGLMRAGIGGLGLLPRDFWALTPFELRVLLGLETALPPLTRARLEDLAARFPDRVKGDRNV